jgi:hypothetical protein
MSEAKTSGLSGGKVFLLFNAIVIGGLYLYHSVFSSAGQYVDSFNLFSKLPGNLKYILRAYEQYIGNPNCVYKMCNGKWFVIMEKIVGKTKDNEKRKNIENIGFAKCRASILRVHAIINIDTLETVNSIENNYQGKKLLYEIGKDVEPDSYDEFDIESICSGGVHYFPDPVAALYYRRRPSGYTGFWLECDYDSGANVRMVEFPKVLCN